MYLLKRGILEAHSRVALFLAALYALVACSGFYGYETIRDFFLNGRPLPPHSDFLAGLAFVAISSFLIFILIRSARQRQAILEQERALESERSALFFNQPFVGMTLNEAETGRYVRFNDHICDMLGYSRAEFSELTWQDIVHPEDWRQRAEERGHFMQGKQVSFSSVARYVRKDGSILFGQVNLSSVCGKDGSLEFVLATVLDVTALKQSAEAAHFQNLMLESMAEIARVGAWSFNVLSGELFCSRMVYAIHGIPFNEPVEVDKALDFYTPEARPVIAAAVRAAIDEGTPYDLQLSLISQCGTPLWVRSQCQPLRENDKTVMLYGAFQDITGQKAAEEALRQSREQFELAVRGSNDGIWDWDIRSNRMFLSPRWKEQLGYNEDELENEFSTFEGLLHPDDRERVLSLMHSHEIGEFDRFRIEFRLRHKDGSFRWMLSRGEAIREAQGRSVRMAGSTADITNYKELLFELAEKEQTLQVQNAALDRYREHLEEVVGERTAKLAAALEEAHAVDKIKDEFLANVSHEMRTPLNVVIGLADLARRTAVDPKQSDYLDKIIGAGRNLAGIINDLLDLSKIAAGYLEFSSEVFSPRVLLSRSHAALLHKAEEKGLLLKEWFDESMPESLIGDPLRIEQILLNLLNNAIKFTPSGRIDARLSLIKKEQGRVCLGIEVEDTGIGISESNRERLFKPFSQVDNSISRKYGGTGLGLAICKRLAEAMGGDISVQSREGGGSVFRVRLWVGMAETENPVAALEEKMDVQKVRFRNVQVLAVDDQPENLEIVEALLRSVGIRPQLAANGQEAIDILQAQGCAAFDLVLMDMQMPVMDGLTASLSIRAMPECGDLPIIAMTAHTMEHEKRLCARAGVNDHIGKPFEVADFHRLLCQWIPRIKQESFAANERVENGAGLPVIEGVDTQAGLLRMVGKVDRYCALLRRLADEAPEMTARLAADWASGDRVAIRKLTHALRGRSGMLGAMDVHGAAAALESALEKSDGVEDRMAALQVALQRFNRIVGRALPVEESL